MGGKRFALLMCGEDSEYLVKMHGGCYGMFGRVLAEEGEKWDLYKVVQGHFPEHDDLPFYDGFVITGSCYDAYANDPWILDLLALVNKLDNMHKKILGICFGHQIVGRALGGKVGRSPNGWDIGVRAINVTSSLPPTLSSLNLPSKLSIFKCHRDEILELPAKAEVIAWSEMTGVEIFSYGDHMLGIQGHPEFTYDILLHFIDRIIQRELVQEAFAMDAKVKAASQESDKETLKKLCRGRDQRMGGKRFALLMCGEDSEYLVKMHGGTYGIFGRVLAEEGEKWDLYKVVQGHFPEHDDLPFYDGFVITGSCYDAHANDPWILDLLALVNKLDNMHKKILGICFGHQANSPTEY
ncbi:Glutamine amidotransferase [Spatholobus suberectus]|nr:Glutamine amidotransferase [Spatholobus suberectus]